MSRVQPQPPLFADMTADQRAKFVAGLDQSELNAWPYHFRNAAHAGQLPPPGDWRTWLVMAGRGFGKTRAGAEWVRGVAEADPGARIALVGASLAEARAVMVEGESGILACCAPDRMPRFEPSLHRLRFPNGAEARLYSAAEPEGLRGPQHSHAWCDEIGKWDLSSERATRAWDNLLLGLRLGRDPRVLATTTPRSVPLVTRLLAGGAAGNVAVTRGTTRDNAANLPPAFIAAVTDAFAGTSFARQELEGELIAEIDGALWSRALLETCREPAASSPLSRVVIGVDPPASAHGDACGIVVAALGEDGIARVLADCSVEKASPERWARAVADAASAWHADRVVAEANQGGAMIASVLRMAGLEMPPRLVHATRGKTARAEPVAAAYEAGKVRHAGLFPALEDQLCGIMPAGRYEGPGKSPDRADALVWALTELLLGGARRRPRVLAI